MFFSSLTLMRPVSRALKWLSRLRNVLKTFTFAYVLGDIPSGFKIVIYI
ncbi:hypothetical protein Asd1617_06108 [Shigella dysenteriae 1617]|uniref:Uncharacterized protein n=1 Tax=Shigella dysenteriae 1617 TaxID=754093 RepID=A0A0A7A458_SHIDY|nr:hypothetical protein Asd1617_06108 [Shigella dysenteriae 1617]